MNKRIGKKIFILAATFFVASLFTYGYMFVSVKNSISRVAEAERDFLEKEKLVEESRGIKSFFRNTEKEMALVSSYSLSEESSISFIEFVESLGRKAGTEIIIDNVSEKEGRAHSKVLEFKVSVVGEWGRVFNFIQMLENTDRRHAKNMRGRDRENRQSQSGIKITRPRPQKRHQSPLARLYFPKSDGACPWQLPHPIQNQNKNKNGGDNRQEFF